MTATTEREQLFTGYSGRLFLSVSVGWLLVQLGRQLIPPLLPNIVADLGITSTQAGFAFTLMWGLYALCQYPSGRLSDRLSRKTLLVSGLSFFLVGLLIIQTTASYAVFLFGGAIVGLGAGLYPTAARALVSDLFEARRGQAFGLHTALGDLGNAVAAGLAVAALAVATWQAAFLPVVALLGLVVVSLHVWSRETYALRSIDLGIGATGRRLFGRSRFRWLLVAYGLFAVTWQSTTAFLPTFLQVEKGLSIGFASAGFALFFLVGALVKPASGLLGDRFGRLTVGLGALFLGTGGLAGMLAADHTLVIFLAIGVFSAGLMSFPPVMQAFLMDVFPDESMGGDLGAIRTFYIGLGSLGPTYVGLVAGRANYTVSFLGLVACLLVAASIIGVSEFLR